MQQPGSFIVFYDDSRRFLFHFYEITGNRTHLISINPALGSPYRLYIQTIAFLGIDIK